MKYGNVPGTGGILTRVDQYVLWMYYQIALSMVATGWQLEVTAPEDADA